MKALTTFPSFRTSRRPLVPLGFVIFWYAGLLFFPMTYIGLSNYQDFVMNAYLWLLLGILFRLPGFAQAARLQETSTPRKD